VTGVPATQDTNINSLNAAGWTLVVVYRDETAPIRNLSVFVGGSFVDEDSQQDYTVSGFCAPPAGEITGTAIVSTIEGDAKPHRGSALIAPTAADAFVQLSGPNNPADNFFCSQLNDARRASSTRRAPSAREPRRLRGREHRGRAARLGRHHGALSSQAGQLRRARSRLSCAPSPRATRTCPSSRRSPST
jgi:hypothetical protein